MTTTYSPLGDLTPTAVLQSGWSLVVACARCREGEAVDVRALATARPKQPLASMTFACPRHGLAGVVSVWGFVDGGRRIWRAARPAWAKDRDWVA